MTCIALWDRSCYCENKHLHFFFFLQNLPCKCSFSCFHLVFPCLKPIKIQNTTNRNTVCCCLFLSHTPKCADTQFGLSVQHLLGGCDLWLSALLPPSSSFLLTHTHQLSPPYEHHQALIHSCSHTHVRLLWLHGVNANKQVCTHDKFNPGGLPHDAELVCVDTRWRRRRGRGSAWSSHNPSARSHSLPAAPANPLKGVCVCVYTHVFMKMRIQRHRDRAGLLRENMNAQREWVCSQKISY